MSRKKLILGCLVALIGGLAIFGLLGFVVTRTLADVLLPGWRYEETKERAKLAGVPVSGADVPTRPPVEPAKNSAPIYARIALAHGEEIDQAWRAMRAALRDPKLGPAEAIRVADGLLLVAGEIERASQMPYYHVERNLELGIDPPLDDLEMLAFCALFIATRGSAYAQLERPEHAARDLATARRIAHHLSQEPVLFAAFLSARVEATILLEARRSAAAVSSSSGCLQSLEAEVLAMGKLPINLRKAIEVEAYKSFVELRHEGLIPGETQPATRPDTETSDPVSEHFRRSREIAGLAPFGSDVIIRTWKARLLEAWSVYLESIPASGAIDAHYIAADSKWLDALNTEMGSYGIAAVFLPNPIASGSVMPARFEYRATRAFIDVLQFRNHHGRWPESLAEAGVRALDPFDAEPLRYRREGEGFRIWSVGPNTRDDGGVTKAGGDSEVADDLAVIYPLPGHTATDQVR